MKWWFRKCKFGFLFCASIALLSLSGISLAQERESESLNECSYDSTIVVSIHPGIPPLRFHVVTHAYYDTTYFSKEDHVAREDYSFVITNVAGSDTIQRIDDGTVASVVAGTFDDAFHIEDINFDGHKDFRYLFDAGATANLRYHYWVYDTLSGKFIEDEALDDLVWPEADSARKEIVTFEKCGGGCWVKSAYKLIGGKPVLSRFLSCQSLVDKNMWNRDFDIKDSSDYSEYVLAKVVKGDTVIVRQSNLTDGEYEKVRKEWWK